MSGIKKRKIAFAEMFRIFHIKNKYFVIYPHKCILNNLKKKYQEKWENAYLRVKNARASRALRRALNPGQYWLALLARLRFATSAKSQKKFLGPPLDQILDPLVLFQWRIQYILYLNLVPDPERVMWAISMVKFPLKYFLLLTRKDFQK